MAAGSVCAPVVIPLREFTPGSRATKNVVDEKTPIELFSGDLCIDFTTCHFDPPISLLTTIIDYIKRFILSMLQSLLS